MVSVSWESCVVIGEKCIICKCLERSEGVVMPSTPMTNFAVAF
jgi:hypothetical protein